MKIIFQIILVLCVVYTMLFAAFLIKNPNAFSCTDKVICDAAPPPNDPPRE